MLTYLSNPTAAATAETRVAPCTLVPPLRASRYPAVERCCGRDGCRRSLRGRSWYDLNEGTIKWRAPLGSVRALVAKGITNTGNAQRVHRNGPVVTAGGLIFIGTNGDGTVRAFDKDTGKVLWERALDANPEGMAAVYEVNDGNRRVCASYRAVAPGNIAISPVSRGARLPSSVESMSTSRRIIASHGGLSWDYDLPNVAKPSSSKWRAIATWRESVGTDLRCRRDPITHDRHRDHIAPHRIVVHVKPDRGAPRHSIDSRYGRRVDLTRKQPEIISVETRGS